MVRRGRQKYTMNATFNAEEYSYTSKYSADSGRLRPAILESSVTINDSKIRERKWCKNDGRKLTNESNKTWTGVLKPQNWTHSYSSWGQPPYSRHSNEFSNFPHHQQLLTVSGENCDDNNLLKGETALSWKTSMATAGYCVSVEQKSRS